MAERAGPPGPRYTVVSETARALGALSLVVSVLWLTPVAVALFALVALGLMVLWLLELRPVVDLAAGLTLLVAAWISIADLYAVVSWLDLAVHLLVTGVLTATVLTLLVRVGAVTHPARLTSPTARVAVVGVAAAVGLGLSVLWELGEWVGFTHLDDSMTVGYDDTLGDLVAGGIGSVLAGMLLVRSPTPSDPHAAAMNGDAAAPSARRRR